MKKNNPDINTDTIQNAEKKIKAKKKEKVKPLKKKLKVESENEYNNNTLKKFSLGALKSFFDLKNKNEPA